MKTYTLSFLGILLSVPALAGDMAIGTVTHLSGTFSVQQKDGTARVLSVRSDVKEGDLLATEMDTYARVKFVDGGEVVLRPNTQFKVEKYSFDEKDESKDGVFLGLLKGGLRAVTGLIGKRSRNKVSFSTSVATIGIRGTNHGMLMCNNDCGDIRTPAGVPPANGLYLDVASGAIQVTNTAGSQLIGVGQFGYVASNTSPPILSPPGQGIQVTMPQSISANDAAGRSPGGATGDTACGL